MSTKMSFITEPLYTEQYREEIKEIEEALQKEAEINPKHFFFTRHENIGYTYFSGLMKDLKVNFTDWEYIAGHIEIDGRKLRISWIGDDNVRGNENELTSKCQDLN